MGRTDRRTRICEILPHLVADGAFQMALDMELLDRASDRGDRALIRTYEWSKPTLSLGYFQKYNLINREDMMSDDEIVRRPTGGGAIRHDRDLTFAVIAPASDPRSIRPVDFYAAVHGAIAALLREEGVEASLRGSIDSTSEGLKPFLCFRDRDASDVVVAGVKVVGGAQRRAKDATLLHGTMRLRGVEVDRDLAGLADVSGASDSADFWGSRVRSRLSELLGWERREVEIGEEVEVGARLRAERVFATDRWTRMR